MKFSRIILIVSFFVFTFLFTGSLSENNVLANEGSLILIAGEGGALYGSTNGGQTWTNYSPSTKTHYTDITLAGNKLLVSGNVDTNTGSRVGNSFMYDFSTEKWSNPIRTSYVNTALYGNEAFFLGGGNSIIGISSKGFTSNDGVNWVQSIDGYRSNNCCPYYTSGNYMGIIQMGTFANGKFVISGNSENRNYMAVSNDGYNWKKRETGLVTYYDMIYVNDQYVAVGKAPIIYDFTNPIISFSDDGLYWEVKHVKDAGYFNGIAYGNGRYIAVGRNSVGSGYIMYSDDNGITWTKGNRYSGVLYDITYDKINDLFIAVGDGYVLTSKDGGTWNKVNAPISHYNTVIAIDLNEIDGISNRPPVLEPMGDKEVNEGELLEIDVKTNDPDGDEISIVVNGLPEGATFDENNGLFSWLPGYNQAGEYEVTFIISDGEYEISDTIIITVHNINLPPVIEPIGDKEVNEGELLEIDVKAYDPDGDEISVVVNGLPEGATFDKSIGRFSWLPGYDQAGEYEVIFEVSDGEFTVRETIKIIVHDVSSEDLIDNLIDFIDNLTINQGIKKAFTSRLSNAVQSIQEQDYQTAVDQLNSIINTVNAQRGKQLEEDDADEIIRQIKSILSSIIL